MRRREDTSAKLAAHGLALGIGLLVATNAGFARASEGDRGTPPATSVPDPPFPAATGATGPSAEGRARPSPNGRPPIAGMFEPPPDTEQEDATLPGGTIAVSLRDADDKAVPNETVTLGILINSIAKGDSRQHLQATTDSAGTAVFTGLETASNIAYRVSSGYQGGLFAASPFQLQQAKAMRVALHVYPVSRDIQQTLVIAESTVAAEVRDDRIQVEEELTFYNLGRVAWQPDDVRLNLPESATAFSSQASMSDQGVDDVGHVAKLHGTFPPGRHAVTFRWQIPWSGETDVVFDVGLPPHAAIGRVMMAGTPDIRLTVTGLPPPDVRHNQQGQRFLVTERRFRPEDARREVLSVGIHGLPAIGPGRLLATGLTITGVLIGLVLAFSQPKKAAARRSPTGNAASSRLLDDLADLERARRTGDVGPTTYEKVRREIVDALARTLADVGS